MWKAIFIFGIFLSFATTNPIKGTQKSAAWETNEVFPPSITATMHPSCLSNEIYFEGSCTALFARGPCPERTWVVVKDGTGACMPYPPLCAGETPHKSPLCLQALAKASGKYCDSERRVVLKLTKSGEVICTCKKNHIYYKGVCFQPNEQGLCPEGYYVSLVDTMKKDETTNPSTAAEVMINNTPTNPVEKDKSLSKTKKSQRRAAPEINEGMTKYNTLLDSADDLDNKQAATMDYTRLNYISSQEFRPELNGGTARKYTSKRTAINVNPGYIDEMDNTRFFHLGGRMNRRNVGFLIGDLITEDGPINASHAKAIRFTCIARTAKATLSSVEPNPKSQTTNIDNAMNFEETDRFSHQLPTVETPISTKADRRFSETKQPKILRLRTMNLNIRSISKMANNAKCDPPMATDRDGRCVVESPQPKNKYNQPNKG